MRKTLIIVALAAGAVAIGNALATPSSGVVAETVRGPVTSDLNVNTMFENGGKVKLKTKGPVEFIVQRIEAAPGATFGWHSHPGENVNLVKLGALTLYHDEDCDLGTNYGPGSVFTTSPSEMHLARNLSSTDTLVFFAVYFAPKQTPDLPVRIDQPLPAPGCPS